MNNNGMVTNGTGAAIPAVTTSPYLITGVRGIDSQAANTRPEHAAE